MATDRAVRYFWGFVALIVTAAVLAPLWTARPHRPFAQDGPEAARPQPPPPPDKPPPTPTPSDPAHETNPLASADAEDGETLLRLIVAEQEKNLAKIRTIKFTYTKFRKGMVPGDEHEIVTKYRIVRSGQAAWCERKFRSHFFNSNKGQSHTDYIVWNEKALMFWPSVGLDAYLWEYTSIDAMPEEARTYMKMAAAFPELHHAFGYGPNSLREMLEDPDKQELRYQVTQDVDGESPVYTVVVLPPERIASHPIMRLTVDPSRGYMVNHKVDFYPASTVPASESWVVPREVAPGIWMPESWEVRVYTEPGSGGDRQSVMIQFQDRVEVEEVNGSVSESQFTWRAAGLKPSTQIRRVDVSGEVSAMQVVNGELVEKVEASGKAP